MTRIGIITQARMTSTRLPGKVLLPASGRTMLEHHLRRLGAAGLQVIVATTTNASDDPIVAAAADLGHVSYRGSEADVLSRFAGAADTFALDVVVRVTSDCPLIDGSLVRRGVETFLLQDDPDTYVSNTLERTYPRGFDFEVFSAAALRDAEAYATSESDREHVTPYINQNRSGRVVTSTIRRDADASRFRVTLDTPEDLEVIRALIERYGAESMTAEEIIGVLERTPDLVDINAGVEQKKLGQ